MTIAWQHAQGKIARVRIEGDRAIVIFRAPGASLGSVEVKALAVEARGLLGQPVHQQLATATSTRGGKGRDIIVAAAPRSRMVRWA